MQSYQISLTAPKRAAGRFIALVRREIQKALAEEHSANGVTQARVANALQVNRSVIHRQIMGFENMTLGRVGEIADVLGREIEFSLIRTEIAGGNHPFVQPLSKVIPTTDAVPSVVSVVKSASASI